MQCSFVQEDYLFIGASNKLYLFDITRDFVMVSQVSLKRQVFTICAMSANKFVVGEQGGYLTMIEVQDDGSMTIEAENKVTSAIFKVIKTADNQLALACSGGLYFAQYDAAFRKFTVSSDFLLMDHLVTQVVEVAPNRFAVGCWGVPWVGLVEKKLRTLIKIDCPYQEETQCTDLIALPGFDIRTYPFLVQRSSKTINLINLANLSMHKMLNSDNQSGSYEKLLIDTDSSIKDQIKLVFVTKDTNIVETVIDSSFVRKLKELVTVENTPRTTIM